MRFDYDSMLGSHAAQAAAVKFALGVSSGRQFVNDMRRLGNGYLTHARQILDTRGVSETRMTLRKALRRRGILNQYNLVSH